MISRNHSFFDVKAYFKLLSKVPPAVSALGLLVAAAFLSFSILYSLNVHFGLTPPGYVFIALMASIATGLAICIRMDWWWWWLLFIFPFAVFFAATLNLPNYYYLVGFSLLLIIFWSTFRTQVPYYPSSSALLPHIYDFLPTDRQANFKFIDIGSGFGGLVLDLAKMRPDCGFSGIEIAPFPWIVSMARAKLAGSPAKFVFGDYQSLNFVSYDIIFGYLSPRAMPGLWLKAKNEMRPGAILLSYEFLIPDVEPDICINSGDNNPILYVWRI